MNTTRIAMAASASMLAYQVAGKAVRDAVFLSVWPASALPVVVIAAAVVAVAIVPLFARLLARFGPRIVVSTGFLLSAAAHMVEWRLSSGTPWVAAVVYVHTASAGALLLSGFWSSVSEIFDVQSAKHRYAQIAAAGTVGGICGGVAAERIAAAFTTNTALPLLAATHALTGAMTLALRSATTFEPAAPRRGRVLDRDSLNAAPYLRIVATIVVLGTASAAILDYLFKARAAVTISGGPDLLQFFAVFYTATQILTFLAQLAVPITLMKLGLGRSLATLPGGVVATSAAALLFPTFPVFLLARGAEHVLRGSTFRSGYELLFNPLGPDEKRRTKAFLDVACDRAGDVVGATIVQIVLLGVPAFATSVLTAAALALASANLGVLSRIETLYVAVVGRRLVQHAGGPPTMISTEPVWTLFETGTLVRDNVRETRLPAIPGSEAPTEAGAASLALSGISDPAVAALVGLRSGNADRVRHVLRTLDAAQAVHVAQIVQLLAWDDVRDAARRMLERCGAAHVGLLVDELLSPAADFAVRRRIPRVLGTLLSQRALDGLVSGLDDPRFEVRYQCGRALDRLRRRAPHLVIDRDRILAVVEREFSVDTNVRRAYRLLDWPEGDDEAAHEASDRCLEHAFTLLGLVLPREEMLVALHGVDSSDPVLRGLALEYLESVLPAPLRARLWTLLDARIEDAQRVTPEVALARLMESQQLALPRDRQT